MRHNSNDAAPVGDQGPAFQFLYCGRDPGSPNTQHQGQEIVRERQFAANTVIRHQ
jgi:hypothetical protein